MTRTLFTLLCLMIVFAGCKKSSDKDAIQIEGFHLFDAMGNAMGTVGPTNHDWELMELSSLSTTEQALLNAADTTNTLNTVLAAVSLHPYPNPVRDYSALAVAAGDSVKFKLVITDKTGVILKQFSQKIKGSRSFIIDVTDRSLFPLGKSLRYLYSFSAAGHVNFKVGYGDIKICDSGAGSPATVCF